MDKCAYVNDGKILVGSVARLRPSCDLTVYISGNGVGGGVGGF